MSRTDRNPRQRLDPETRKASILDAAYQAFAKLPYDTVVVAEVAEDAGASEALLYRYYNSKAELYLCVVEQVSNKLLADQLEAAKALDSQATGRERVKATLDIYLDRIVSDAELLLPSHDPSEVGAQRREIRDQQIQLLRRIANFPPRFDYSLIGYLGFVEAVAGYWYEQGCPNQTREELAEAALDSLFGPSADSAAPTIRYNKFGNPI